MKFLKYALLMPIMSFSASIYMYTVTWCYYHLFGALVNVLVFAIIVYELKWLSYIEKIEDETREIKLEISERKHKLGEVNKQIDLLKEFNKGSNNRFLED